MDFIWNSITDWLKEVLVSGIVSNLSGMFDSTNEQIGEIAGQVGLTPQAWNSGIFNMIQNLSNNVILPLAGAILAIVMTLELIQLITDRNNLNDVDTWMFFKWVFKSAAAVLIVSNTWTIVMGIFDAAQSVVNGAAGVMIGNTSIDISSVVTDLESRLMEMDVGPLLGLWFQSLFVGICTWAITICIFIVIYGRMIEVYLVTSVAPIPMATMANREWGQMGQNYLRTLFALGFQAFLIMVCVAIYSVLVQNMYLKKEKGDIWKWIGLFFSVMILFTILSRAIYQHSTAVVTTKMPSSGTINHTVQINGKTVQNQELAVTTIGGLRISSICVNEGQQVKQGDVLFALDLDYLDEAILKQEQDMKKQQLSVWDAWAQNSNAQKQKENQQAQAEENYNNAVSQAETAVERAKRDLERAKAALENFYNGVTSDNEEEEALRLAYQETKADYDSAVGTLKNLQREIDQAVLDAIAQAEREVQQQGTVVQAETTVPEESEPEITELTQEQKEQIEASVRASYADRISAAQAAVQQAQQAATDADTQLEAFYQRQSSGAALSEQDLLDAVEQALEVYDDAVAALESTKTTHGRAVSSANLPASTSNSAQIGQITYDQMKMELEKLEALQKAEGKILSPTDGIVTKCNVQTGEKTTDTTAILLADLGQGCKFSGLATEEDSQYIGVGDKVLLQTSNGKAYKDLPVTTFSTTEEPGGGYRLTVQIPSGNLALGANVHLSFTKKSQPYSCCVPLSALRLDNRNQTYVLVVQEVISVMGTELQAKKVNVTVLEQNETMAALAEGTLGSKDKVIVGSDKTIDIGSRVRVE